MFTSLNGIMVRVLIKDVVDRSFEPKFVQTKDYEDVMCCLSATSTQHQGVRSHNG